ncbi:hypothetical protein Ferp_0932 [Ferroglobus placidus DSM 10642]|uniref:Uncharacterized protein n=1 Tax=Ferroglobus placidus (strain DSM 10642 / AEDII12DO) TaxID=589924 RepID=D3RX85_FERPA|nr:hypothetical protein [Ferroglobus placidus]ADC65098.1 hypothetical protein Ferp_0932 [Ferroglobus placidus DSM 10642]
MDENFIQGFVVVLLIFALWILLAFLPTRDLNESVKKRTRDLIIVGLILWLSPDLKSAGAFVFFYGYALLLYEKYQKGRKEVDNSEKKL